MAHIPALKLAVAASFVVAAAAMAQNTTTGGRSSPPSTPPIVTAPAPGGGTIAPNVYGTGQGQGNDPTAGRGGQGQPTGTHFGGTVTWPLPGGDPKK